MFASVKEVQDNLAKARQRIMSGVLMQEGTIEDYPIGGKHRGKCKLGVEGKAGKFRTVRTTTSKSGAWCAPKKSTFAECHTCVIHDSLTDRLGWLRVGLKGISIQWANGAADVLASPPNWCKPRREPDSYKLITRDPFTDEILRTEHHTQPADPPELCDSYDA